VDSLHRRQAGLLDRPRYAKRRSCERRPGGANTAPAALLIPRRAKVFDLARRRPETNKNLNGVPQHRRRRESPSRFPKRNGCVGAAQAARYQHHLFAGVLLAQATESFAEAEGTSIGSVAVHQFIVADVPDRREIAAAPATGRSGVSNPQPIVPGPARRDDPPV
jgi:hypothetical protein